MALAFFGGLGKLLGWLWTRVELNLRAMGLVFALLYVLNTIVQERRSIGCIPFFEGVCIMMCCDVVF